MLLGSGWKTLRMSMRRWPISFGPRRESLPLRRCPAGMVILAATNVSPEVQKVNEALRALRREGKGCFLARLKRAVKDGQLPPGTDVEALASTLNTMLEGMSLQARDGVARGELNRVAATVMALLPGKETNRRLPREQILHI
jgi:AcrR family transcriptional regulator